MHGLQTAVLLFAAVAVAAGADPPSVPSQMRAAAIDRAGGPEALTLHTLPVPKPAANEVLIAVEVAGVAGWDAGIRRHPESIHNSRMPLVLGTDGAGVIAALGANVHGRRVGDPVYAYSWDNPQGGFYAEYVAVPAARVGRIPKGLTTTQAGAIGTTALTAIQGIDDALRIRSGERLVVHGAAGGVGTLAVQFARLRGARVLATVSDADEVALVKALGADMVVDARHGDVPAALHAFAPHGVDAVLALAGGEALERCLDALRHGGRAAYPNGVRAPKARAQIEVRAYDAVPGPREFQRLNEAIESMKLQVPIAAQYPLAEAAAAHARIDAGHVPGKIVLRVR